LIVKCYGLAEATLGGEGLFAAEFKPVADAKPRSWGSNALSAAYGGEWSVSKNTSHLEPVAELVSATGSS
jgi:hypothetical protein